MLEITPILNKNSRKPLYMQLADYIKQEITSGKIGAKEKLPSKRKLASHLELSINTVQTAYGQLGAEGYIESRPRRGLFVTQSLEGLSSALTIAPPLPTETEQVQENVHIDFNLGKVDLEHFPYKVWKKLTVESIYEDRGALFYTGHLQGERCLREVIANYLFESRGVRCTAEQIVLGAGMQNLIGILCLILGNEYTYALENPGFHRTKTVLQNQGRDTISIPLDQNGINVDQLKKSGARVAYVTPSHQFPYGMVMPLSRRLDLLKWAGEQKGIIIEDDYDGEYRYEGKPIPSLQGLSTKENVVYLGTFSKSLIPSIRLSYMVLPKVLLQEYQSRFVLYKQTTSRLHQDTLYRFMDEGHWQRHINKMRTLYRKKQRTLMSAIKKYMGDQVKVIGEKSGLHVVLKVRTTMSEETLLRLAMKAGIKVYPFSIYDDNKISKNVNPKVLLGFGGLSTADIESGIRSLQGVWNI